MRSSEVNRMLRFSRELGAVAKVSVLTSLFLQKNGYIITFCPLYNPRGLSNQDRPLIATARPSLFAPGRTTLTGQTLSIGRSLAIVSDEARLCPIRTHTCHVSRPNWIQTDALKNCPVRSLRRNCTTLQTESGSKKDALFVSALAYLRSLRTTAAPI